MKALLIAGFFSFVVHNALSHSVDQPSTAAQEIAALDFLVGDWRGDGWIVFPSGERHEILQTERITPLLNGEVILIEGRGVSAVDTNHVVHQAVAFIGYDEEADDLVMRTFLPGGQGAVPIVQVGNQNLMWQIGSNIRYTINLNEHGQWYEVGEFSRDEGQTWTQFFEMTLDREK